MDFIADTSVVISFLRGRQPAAGVVRELLQWHQMYLASVVAFDLLAGSKPGTKAHHDLEELLMATGVPAFDYPAAREAARIERELRGSGTPIGVGDLVIAAIALRRGMAVLTEDIAHFQRIPGLVVWSPAEGVQPR